MMLLVSAALATFAASAALTWVVRAAAWRFGWLVQPRADRAHTTPTAMYGGVAIFCALAGGIGAFAVPTAPLLALLGLTAVMFVLGMVDDTRDLSPPSKLVVQIASGLLLYFSGFHFNQTFPWLLDLAIVVFWVVAITNAMNLLDNMNGLCAGTAIIAAAFRCAFYYQDANFQGALHSAVFLGAVAGFLIYNFPTASIFMGDTGSMVVGFFLAALNLSSGESYSKGLLSVLFFPVLVLALPIFDTAFVSMARLLSGRAVSEGGRDHTSHRLVAVGLSETAAVLTFYGISIAGGATAFALYHFGISRFWSLAVLLVLGLMLFAVFLANVHIYPEDRLDGSAAMRQRFSIASDFRYKRVVLWVAVDTLTILLAWYSAFFVRFSDTAAWDEQQVVFAASAPVAVTGILIGLFASGLYRTDWKHFSVHEIRAIGGGALLGLAATLVILGVSGVVTEWRYGLASVAWAATVLMLSSSRMFVRGLADAMLHRVAAAERLLVYGAGKGGELAIRELRSNPGLAKKPIGFVDDDARRVGMSIHGVSVLGTLEDLPTLIAPHRIDGVVVSTRKLGHDREVRLRQLADDLGLRVYRLHIGVVALDAAAEPPAVPPELAAADRERRASDHHGRHPLPGSAA